MGMDEEGIKGKKRGGSKEGSDSYDDADDFLDEDSDPGDQEWESYGAEEDDEGSEVEEPVVRRKKGFFSFNAIVIIIAVVFGGAFIAMQLSKHAPKQQATAQQQVASTGLQMLGQKERMDFNRIDDPSAVPGLPPEPKGGEEVVARQGAGLPLPTDGEEMPPMPGIPDSAQKPDVSPALPAELPEPGVMADSHVSSPAGSAMDNDVHTAPKPGAGDSSDVLTPMPDVPKGFDLPPEKTVTERAVSPGEVGVKESEPPLPRAGDIFKATEKKTVAPQMPAAPVKKVDALNLDENGVSSDVARTLSSGEGKQSIVEQNIPESQDVSELKAQLSGLGERLDHLEKVLSESKPVVSSEKKDDADIEKLKETVKRLETRLSTLSSSGASSAVSGKSSVLHAGGGGGRRFQLPQRLKRLSNICHQRNLQQFLLVPRLVFLWRFGRLNRGGRGSHVRGITIFRASLSGMFCRA